MKAKPTTIPNTMRVPIGVLRKGPEMNDNARNIMTATATDCAPPPGDRYFEDYVVGEVFEFGSEGFDDPGPRQIWQSGPAR